MYEQLRAGEAYFAIRQNKTMIEAYGVPQSETIKEKTYRVFVNNGKSSRVYYVSKMFPMNNFLAHLNIEKVDLAEQMKFATTSATAELSKWWIRNINDSDVVLVKADIQKISRHYLTHFSKHKLNVGRENGYSTVPAHLNVPKDSMVILKVTGSREVREFQEYKKKQIIAGGGGDDAEASTVCTLYHRNQKSSSTQSLQLNDFLGSLSIGNEESYGKSASLRLMSGIENGETFAEFAFKGKSSDLEISLGALPQDTYITTGVYHHECSGGKEKPSIKSSALNGEAKMKLEIEAYVEKL
jgi:hypothetical protein